ncbi:MAG: DUF4238 domain-containing protein [Tabrizicola sp.]|nr:DUF4238 domain-containing protein [Tabrizicola sp.]
MAPSAIGTTFVYAAFLWSDNVEFIFGDGLAQSILQGGNPDSPSGDCVVPLLPNLCVYLKTARSVRDGRNGCIFRANDDAVHHINKLTQIYASHEIFYRNHSPRISEHFRRGEHLVVDYQKSWLFQRLATTIDAMRDGRELDWDQA